MSFAPSFPSTWERKDPAKLHFATSSQRRAPGAKPLVTKLQLGNADVPEAPASKAGNQRKQKPPQGLFTHSNRKKRETLEILNRIGRISKDERDFAQMPQQRPFILSRKSSLILLILLSIHEVLTDTLACNFPSCQFVNTT
ncbi:MAG: hypothetical protein PHQ12_02190 [Chthoniobacteraceae bacterium]|nr:hypothetical protein [Chthoniobacteraceae bacterium]